LTEAARIRAATGLKLPDSIHVATARRNECAVFVTNDASLAHQAGIQVLLLSDA
jgi:predicted nucleic acid-binding protein